MCINIVAFERISPELLVYTVISTSNEYAGSAYGVHMVCKLIPDKKMSCAGAKPGSIFVDAAGRTTVHNQTTNIAFVDSA